MAIKRPDTYEHTNPNLPIVDAKNVGGGFFSVNSVAERNTIPIAKRSKLIDVKGIGLFRYVGVNYEDVNWLNTLNFKNLNAINVLDADGNDSTDADLDNKYPVEKYGLNIIRYTDEGASSEYLYFRKSLGNWVRFSSENIVNSLFAKKGQKRKFVDENGLTLMEVPLNKPIMLKGIKAKFDLLTQTYSLESILDAPLISFIEPSNVLPDNNAIVIIYGASLTQSTTVTTLNSDITINYATFKIHKVYKVPIIELDITVNNAYQGDIQLIVDNGKKAIFNDKLFSVLGTLIDVLPNDFILESGVATISNKNEILKTAQASSGIVKINKPILNGQNFQFRFTGVKSVYQNNTYTNGGNYIYLYDNNGIFVYGVAYYYLPSTLRIFDGNLNTYVTKKIVGYEDKLILDLEFILQRVGTQLVLKLGNNDVYSFNTISNQTSLTIKAKAEAFDLKNFKLIELN